VPAEPANLKGVRVLIVDEHEDSLHMFMEALDFCGASVLGVSSAQQAATHLDEIERRCRRAR
jgi:PleD family two-component response regulator